MRHYRDTFESFATETSTSAPAAAKPVATPGQLADFLVNGYWQSEGSSPHHWAQQTISVNITDLTAQEQVLAATALNAWHEVCGLNFVFTSGAADITYVNDNVGEAYADASWDGAGAITSAFINIGSGWGGPPSIYSYSYQTYLHETGHALGLGHQGPYNGDGDYASDALFANDTWQFSVMSYFEQDNYGGTANFVITPQLADITAVQSLYGAAFTRGEDNVYGFNSNAGVIYDFSQYNGTPSLTIYDSGGTDTLDCSGCFANQRIDLQPGVTSSVGGYVNNITIFSTTLVENAVGGSGGDIVIGNYVANRLFGMSGNDQLYGLEGEDYLQGNQGNDYLLAGVGNDTLRGGQNEDQLFSEAGNDLINGDLGSDLAIGGAGSDTLRGGQNEDGLYGEDDNDMLFGDKGNDVVDGGSGNDTIAGGIAEDQLTGGWGDDLFAFAADHSSLLSSDADQITDFDDFGNDALDFGPGANGTNLAIGSANTYSEALSLADAQMNGTVIYSAINIGGNAWVFWDATGDGSADLAVVLAATDIATIGADDFV